MEALDLAVLRKEKRRCGAASERRRTRVRRGPAWVPKGKARTAMWFVVARRWDADMSFKFLIEILKLKSQEMGDIKRSRERKRE